MTPPFFFLLAAAGIFRLLSSDSQKAFNNGLSKMLPRNVMERHWQVLQGEFPDRLGEFRRRVLPFSALYVALNAAACICFASALWFFPPTGMAHWDLVFVRYGSLLITPVAFLVDAVGFGRMWFATFVRAGAADEAA